MSFKVGDLVVGRASGRIVEVSDIEIECNSFSGKVVDYTKDSPIVDEINGYSDSWNISSFKLYKRKDVGFEF